MKVYFYHTQDIQYILKRMEKGEFPPHFLYGATKLERHGIGVVWHRSRLGMARWCMMIYNLWQILTRREHFDAVYATHYRGIELLIFLRALHLYPKPVVIWHHQPVVRSSSVWREWLGRLFYKGIDGMFFFSRKLMDDSLDTGKVAPERMYLGHWGADLDFYDRILRQHTDMPNRVRRGFISTGKEMRDMRTLIEAFNATGAPLEIYIGRKNGKIDYEGLFRKMEIGSNVHIHYPQGLLPYELALEVNKAACVVVCCMETKYTVGLTTVVEALALGIPVICSKNPQIPINLDDEACGISVAYGDEEGWKRAISYLQENPEEARLMGCRGRALAKRIYNDEHCAQEVSAVLHKVIATSYHPY